MDFTPHGFCLAWYPPLLWITVAGHALVAVAYFAIPFVLIVSARKVWSVPTWLILLFAGFIFLCGMSHLLEILILWESDYWWLAMEVMATAVVSVVTLLLLPRGVRQIYSIQDRR